MIGPALLAALGTTGLLLIARGLRPAPRPLAAVFADLERPRWDTDETAASWRRRAPALAVALIEGSGRDLPALRSNLAVVGRSLERHAVDKLGMAALGFGLPVLFAVVVRAGGIALPVALVGLCALGALAAGFVQPDIALRAEAARRRRDFRHALGAFLDLVTIILAGGGGVESALDAGAGAGDGWAFGRIRHALAVSRLNRESPWVVLARMADDLDVPELRELASSIGLAGDSGAKVRQSLAAKAASMREHELAEAHAAAEAATERMSAPVVVMLLGFILLIGYPAVANVLTL